MLRRAGVSRTAYYSLARKDSVLPKSVHAIATALQVTPSRILGERARPERRARELIRELERIMAEHPRASREDVWHTLLLLEQRPIERLRRGLLRGQRIDLH
jgi:hypothetical protein